MIRPRLCLPAAVLLIAACAAGRAAHRGAIAAAPTLEAALARSGHHDIRRVHDGALILVEADGKLLAAPRGCAEPACTAVVGEAPFGFITVEPLIDDRWFVVRQGVHEHSWHGDDDAQIGVAVALDSPPRVGCRFGLGGRGCNTEWGYCTTRETELVAPDDAHLELHTTQTDSRELGATRVCSRLALTADCAEQVIDCPAADSPAP